MSNSFDNRTTIFRRLVCFASILSIAFLSGCATESHRTLTPETVPSSKTVYHGVKNVLVVGKFQNRSAYMRVFSPMALIN